MNIREKKIEDKNTLIGLVSMMISNDEDNKISTIVVDEFYEKNQYVTYVLEIESGVIGFVVLKLEPFDGGGNLAEIVFLGINKNEHYKGYGTKLVEFIEQYGRDNNIRKYYVKTSVKSKAAVCFWICKGYQFEARLQDFGASGYDDYYFGKVL